VDLLEFSSPGVLSDSCELSDRGESLEKTGRVRRDTDVLSSLSLSVPFLWIRLINVTQALGEMAILYPVSGGFYTLTERMVDSSFAFAMVREPSPFLSSAFANKAHLASFSPLSQGWNYVLQWAVVLPLEITVAGTTVQYWTGDSVPIGAWITVFFAVIIIASMFGTLGFAEEEFWSSCLKLTVVVIFIVTGIVCESQRLELSSFRPVAESRLLRVLSSGVCGGGPARGAYSEYSGGAKWQNPGGFANGFKGVCGESRA